MDNINQKKTTFIVCGLGHIGTRHATIILNNPDAELLCVVDSNEKLANHPLVIQNNVVFYTDLMQACAKYHADIICVCTPNGSHAPLAHVAMDNNCNVIIEKPMCLTTTDCEEIIKKSINKNRHVFVVKQNRYSPPSVWLKEVVDSKILGDIYMVQLNCYWNRTDDYYNAAHWRGTKNMDGGVLYTQFSHFIDLLYWVFGDIDDIKANFNNFAHTHNTEFEDSGVVQFHFKNTNKTLGCIQYSTATYHENFETSLTIIAQHGTIKISGQYADKLTHCHIQNYTPPTLPPTPPQNNYGTYTGSAANHEQMIQNAINTLHHNHQPTANPHEGKAVVNIIERIYNLRKI